MQVQQCFYPQVITNKYTGEEQVVSCGHCPACVNIRSSYWSQRLQLECQCHRYCLLFTLQYDELHVPQVVRADDLSDGLTYVDATTGLAISYRHPSIKRASARDTQFVHDTKVLRVHRKSDFQKFVKLFRYYARQIDPSSKIRYYACGEYGETTFRPHYHVLFWFDSERLASEAKSILSKSWKLGHVHDPHFVVGSSRQPVRYVTNYVTSVTDLPSIFSHREIRPFALFSKCPAIGSLQANTEEVRKIVSEKATHYTVYDRSSNEFKSFPLPLSVRNRLFGKVPRFGCLDRSLLLQLYRIGFEQDFDTAENAAFFLFGQYCRKSGCSDLHHYFRKICEIVEYRDPLTGRLHGDGRTHFPIRKVSLEPLKRFWYIVNRVAYTATSLGYSCEEYVDIIIDYYEKIKKDSYASYVTFVNQTKDVPEDFHVFADFSFIDRVNGKHIDQLSENERDILYSYGLIDADSDSVFIDLDNYKMFSEYKHLQEVISHNNKSNKRRNDYLMAHSDKFKAQINYFNLSNLVKNA